MADDAGNLRDSDFYAWTLVQAEALRARSANAVEWDQVAEELENVGRSELRGVESLAELIVVHLHLLRSGRLWEPRRGWVNEVTEYRRQLRKNLTPALHAKLESELEGVYEGALLRLKSKLSFDEVFFNPIDTDLRWSLAQLLGDDDDPLAVFTATKA